MRKIIIFLLLLVPFIGVSAQSVFVKVGGGFASQTGAAGHSGAAKLAFGYEYEFNQRFAFAPALGITGRGWSIKDEETPDMLYDADGKPTGQQRPVLDEEGNPVEGKYMWSMMHRSYTANYLTLDLPFNYYLRTGERQYFTLTAGPWLGYGIAGKRTTEGDGRRAGGEKIRYTDSTFSLEGAHRFDCGLKAGIGYQFPSSLTINLEGEFGILKTNTPSFEIIPGNCNPPVYIDDFGTRAGRNLSLMITLSYRLNKHKWKGED